MKYKKYSRRLSEHQIQKDSGSTTRKEKQRVKTTERDSSLADCIGADGCRIILSWREAADAEQLFLQRTGTGSGESSGVGSSDSSESADPDGTADRGSYQWKKQRHVHR